MRCLVLIAHNVRSCHNVGSLLRTAEGLGVEAVYLTGYTPYPLTDRDSRLPHLAKKLDTQIHKTALGAQTMVKWQHTTDIRVVISHLQKNDYRIIALEQTTSSIALPGYRPSGKLAVIVGREVEGIEPDVLALADEHVSIPMFGKKESFNVVQAAAMALYHCRFADSCMY